MAASDAPTASDKPPILIGTWGFDHDAWTPAFYPPELPRDWRFAYYSNWFRALLLPAETPVQLGRAALEEWRQDADPEFQFVIELPAAAIDAALAGQTSPLADYLKLIEPLGAHTAGFVLASRGICHAPDNAACDLLAMLNGRPASVTAEPMPAECEQRLKSLGVGILWEPDRRPAPVAAGALLVVRTRTDSPRAQRELLEAVTAWHVNGGTAAVFFEHPSMAQQARLLAELMEV